MLRRLFACLSLLCLTAGGAVAQTGNPTHDALAARGDSDRRAELQHLLQAKGFRCTTVILAYSAGMDGDRIAYWDLRCRDGGSFRATVPPQRFAVPHFLTCGAAAPPPASGPCFRPIAAAPPPHLATGIPDAAQDRICAAACATQPAAATQACMASCRAGGGVARGRQLSEGLPANSRFGAIYATAPPNGALGFANGVLDRLAVNRTAAGACQDVAGLVPCLFQRELVNQCGAIAQSAVRGAENSPDDFATFVVNAIATGVGTSRQAAEMAALEACRVSPSNGAAGGAICRVAASGC